MVTSENFWCCMILYFILGCIVSVDIIDSNSHLFERVVVGGSTTLSSDKHWRMKDLMKVQPALELLSMPVSNDSVHNICCKRENLIKYAEMVNRFSFSLF